MNIIVKNKQEGTDINLKYREFTDVIGTYIEDALNCPLRVLVFKDGSEIAFPIAVSIYVEV